MDSDRELLGLAAKAAGLTIHAPRQAERDEQGYGNSGLWIVNGSTCWNPLADDGDALRLAVTLRMVVDNCSPFAEACCFSGEGDDMRRHGHEELIEAHNGDRLAATRRAIVRAAAEIGRGKEQR